MRIANCINCNEYKYIEKEGKCRNCIQNNKLNKFSGTSEHRYLVKKAYQIFVNKNYNVTINNSIKSLDAIAKSNNNVKLFKNKDVALKATTSTLKNPNIIL